VRLNVGVQHFQVGPDWDTEEEARSYAVMLESALAQYAVVWVKAAERRIMTHLREQASLCETNDPTDEGRSHAIVIRAVAAQIFNGDHLTPPPGRGGMRGWT
jgi:hypothetical protein